MSPSISRPLTLVLLILASTLLIPLQIKEIGWVVWLLGLASLLIAEKRFARHLLLIFISIGLLGLTHINTSITPQNIIGMSIPLGLAVAIPYLVTRFIYKEAVIEYPLHWQPWTKKQIAYLALAAILAYLLLPLWMTTTGGYHNWHVDPQANQLSILFLGTNGLGIWDELFFIITVLALLRQHLSFKVANVLQAIIFTGFLYELGFTGWAFLAIFPFALLQGLVFKNTHNLWYVVAIHLTIDLVLYLALINAHHPHLADIFLIKPSQ